MYFVKVNEKQGINLDTVVSWYDMPDLPVPQLNLDTVAPSANGEMPQPYVIELIGPEREAMLHWLAQVGPDDDWKTAYEEILGDYRAGCDSNVELRCKIANLEEEIA